MLSKNETLELLNQAIFEAKKIRKYFEKFGENLEKKQKELETKKAA